MFLFGKAKTFNTQTKRTKHLLIFPCIASGNLTSLQLSNCLSKCKNPEDEWIFHFATSVTSGSVGWTNQENIHLNGQEWLTVMEEGAEKKAAKSWGVHVVVCLSSDQHACLFTKCQGNIVWPILDTKSQLKVQIWPICRWQGWYQPYFYVYINQIA